MWGAVSLLTKGASLQDFAASLVDTAAGIEAAGLLDGDQLGKIKASLDARGLFDCGRALSLNKGPRAVKMRGLGYMGKCSRPELRAGAGQAGVDVELPVHLPGRRGRHPGAHPGLARPWARAG